MRDIARFFVRYQIDTENLLYLTREEQRMLNGEWCAKILALWDKMDARKQGRPDTPLDEQLANLRALGVEQ